MSTTTHPSEPGGCWTARCTPNRCPPMWPPAAASIIELADSAASARHGRAGGQPRSRAAGRGRNAGRPVVEHGPIPGVYELDNAAADRAIDAGTTEAMNGANAIAAIKRRPR